MGPYYDSQNGGLANDLQDTVGGQIFYLGNGLDYCTGTSGELFDISGGFSVWQGANQFKGVR